MSSHSHPHAHNESGEGPAVISGRKIFWVTVLNAGITAAEVAGGLLSGSLALLSDAAHNLSDTVAVALSYLAFRIARRPNDRKKTFGYRRAEIVSAFVNSGLLLGILAVLLFEAVRRLWSPEAVDSGLMIVVALAGLVANLLSVLLLKRDSKKSLNIKASYLHLMGDTVSSVGVVLGALVIRLTGAAWVDPLVTILVALWILREAWQVMKKALDILMQSSADLDYEAIKKDVEGIERVRNIHHVHTWMGDERTVYFEAHVDMENISLCEAGAVYEKIERLLKERYGVSHVTLQAESDTCRDLNLFKC